MEEKIICGFCGCDKWIQQDDFPLVRKCANPNCNGLHPKDVSKHRDIKGQIYDSDKNVMTDIDELEKCMK